MSLFCFFRKVKLVKWAKNIMVEKNILEIAAKVKSLKERKTDLQQTRYSKKLIKNSWQIDRK